MLGHHQALDVMLLEATVTLLIVHEEEGKLGTVAHLDVLAANDK